MSYKSLIAGILILMGAAQTSSVQAAYETPSALFSSIIRINNALNRSQIIGKTLTLGHAIGFTGGVLNTLMAIKAYSWAKEKEGWRKYVGAAWLGILAYSNVTAACNTYTILTA